MFRTRSIASIAQPLRANLVRNYASTVTVASTRSNASAPLLGNIEASWKDLSAAEQAEIQEQIAELEKKDWKELSMDEKKAGEFKSMVAGDFGFGDAGNGQIHRRCVNRRRKSGFRYG